MLQGLKLTYKQWISLCIIVFLFCIKLIWYDLYMDIINFYIHLIVTIGTSVFRLLGFEINKTTASIILNNSETISVLYGFLSLKLVSLSCAIVIINTRFKFKYLILYLGWITLANVLRLIILVFIKIDPETLLSFNHFNFYRSIISYFPVMVYWRSYKNLNSEVKGFNVSDIGLKISLLLFLYYLVFFIINLLGEKGMFISNILSDTILYLSKFSLSFLGYNADISGSVIGNSKTFVKLADGCIGINITLVFCGIFVFYERISWKLVSYILSGVVLIFFINAMRITYLFIYIEEHGNDSTLFKMHHDLYNVFIYAFIVLLWYLWFFYYKKEEE